MTAKTMQIQDLSDLRCFVQEVMCEQNSLEIGAFQVTERILIRGGEPCGMFFCLHGPRSVKLTAIWETDQNTVRFYGSAGERQYRCRLAMAPSLAGHRVASQGIGS